jgi:hypothetical protein
MIISPNVLERRLLKVIEPIPHKFEPFALNPVNAHPTLPFVSEQASVYEDLEVTRGGLPSMLEDLRNLTG